MDNFRIIEDRTIDYGVSGKLYIMLIKINESFCFQIDNRYKGICRRTIYNRKTGESVVESIVQSLCTYKDMESAYQIIYQGLKMKTVQEFLFLLKTNKELEYEEIFILKKRFGYMTYPIAGKDTDFGFIEIHDEISIIFPNQDIPIGHYRPISKESNTYRFHLNELYLFRD